MVDINLPNFITVGLIAVVFIVALRWALKSTGMPQVV
jgi:hypothetical protein